MQRRKFSPDYGESGRVRWGGVGSVSGLGRGETQGTDGRAQSGRSLARSLTYSVA